MAFIRIKKIKGNEYVYLSENRWMKRSAKVKQETKKYLGKLIRLNPVNETEFFSFHNIQDIEGYMEDKYKEELIYDVIKWELAKHGFTEVRNVWRKEGLYVNLRLKQVMENDKDVVLGMNEGYLSGHTISRLVRFKAYVEEDAYDLAKFFVEAGLKVPKEVFISIFGKHNVGYDEEEVTEQ